MPNTSHGKFGIYLPCSREKGTIFIFEIMCDCLQEYVLPGCEEIHKVLFAFFCSFLMVLEVRCFGIYDFSLFETQEAGNSCPEKSHAIVCACLLMNLTAY